MTPREILGLDPVDLSFGNIIDGLIGILGWISILVCFLLAFAARRRRAQLHMNQRWIKYDPAAEQEFVRWLGRRSRLLRWILSRTWANHAQILEAKRKDRWSRRRRALTR
ncbi:MAG TPA: hypothetical protein VJB93_00345 [Patescibacteria group bacterium]|nr:hypothetical protein [Patescibacteria group bacterium]